MSTFVLPTPHVCLHVYLHIFLLKLHIELESYFHNSCGLTVALDLFKYDPGPDWEFRIFVIFPMQYLQAKSQKLLIGMGTGCVFTQKLGQNGRGFVSF